ncbi:maleylpyruvate isomerase family mycothiol-dependent enzyme [Nonomuraea cavernae]|uniref:Maleylpyruvate isomerase n=1 Tax=Nonomuraea cavernae TaxID=2045107 RepID=A0A917Z606_9ACTN|nr:maleylpyruvate isomerase family mycothiol-dependent enzyme [Nonomuraea cavernae]MCA2189066.1 maleylpyruvate isomerase family mycothiol-dependent enzyme [Nonomuraea cavernae]GGO76058.1 maleylpyruvate isomerase [Nonomuraea cavernae]
MTVIPALKAELADATRHLLATAATLSDGDVSAPSRLPGWTRGHVLTHVARNADSHVNLLTWARTGVKTPQYATPDARQAGIEAGAGRGAAEQLADLEDSAARLTAAIDGLPGEAWSAPVAGLRPTSHPAWYILVRRLREIGMHHVDLDAGFGPADWSGPFVTRELHDCLRTWPYERSPVSEIRMLGADGTPTGTWRGLGDGPAVEGLQADLLAWLTGRSDGRGVRVVLAGQRSGPGPATVPAPPPWLTTLAPADLPETPPKDYP